MVTWNRYNRNHYTPDSSTPAYEPIPEGDYRVRIDRAEEMTSKKGYDMIKLTLAVSGFNARIFYYLAFMPDNAEVTNQNLGAIWDSFGIPEGEINALSWEGKVGAARVVNELYREKLQSKVDHFISRATQAAIGLSAPGQAAQPSSVPI